VAAEVAAEVWLSSARPGPVGRPRPAPQIYSMFHKYPICLACHDFLMMGHFSAFFYSRTSTLHKPKAALSRQAWKNEYICRAPKYVGLHVQLFRIAHNARIAYTTIAKSLRSNRTDTVISVLMRTSASTIRYSWALEDSTRDTTLESPRLPFLPFCPSLAAGRKVVWKGSQRLC
jgi:hypothetical protein